MEGGGGGGYGRGGVEGEESRGVLRSRGKGGMKGNGVIADGAGEERNGGVCGK